MQVSGHLTKPTQPWPSRAPFVVSRTAALNAKPVADIGQLCHAVRSKTHTPTPCSLGKQQGMRDPPPCCAANSHNAAAKAVLPAPGSPSSTTSSTAALLLLLPLLLTGSEAGSAAGASGVGRAVACQAVIPAAADAASTAASATSPIALGLSMRRLL